MSVNKTESTNSLSSGSETKTYQKVALVLGPLIAVLMLLIADKQSYMPVEAWKVAAVTVWMAMWWATEAIPVPATAFLPLVLLPLLGVRSMADSATPYANPIIYLFLGAFLLAIAIEKWQLHRRIALNILVLTGTNGSKLIASFMFVTALLSMWMTNTSTTMMMMPIALSVAGVVVENASDVSKKSSDDFKKALLLGIAFSATIGGMSTLIGTPPNAILAAFLAENYDIKLSFATWMMLGVPFMCVMLPITWWVLTRTAFSVNVPDSDKARKFLAQKRIELGKMSQAEKRVALLFLFVVVAWMFRKPISDWSGLLFLSDAGIAMAAATSLFVIPSGSKAEPALLTWEDVSKMPLGVLILFGGGLALAAAVSQSGLAQWLGASISPLGQFGIFVILMAATAMVIFLTELTSNIATTATFLPVVAAVALELNISPLVLCVPVTLAASCAFMLPVATAPNAIVFSSGFIRIPDMVRAGVMLNIMGLVILSCLAYYFVPILF